MRRAILLMLPAIAAVTGMGASRAGVLAGAQGPADPVFTTAQAIAGKTAYAKHCASCHMPDLSGNAEIPPLAGSAFKGTWGSRSTKDLFDYMSAAMPYGGASLSSETYADITAFILEFNGAVAGERALSATTSAPIGSLMAARPAQPAVTTAPAAGNAATPAP
jgi:mono/diheme cytochrome c family protein